VRETERPSGPIAQAEIGSADMATCYRHPSRETGVSCASCGRPICPDCMTTTPVGMRCPECSRQRTKVVRMRDMATVPQVTYALIAINVIAFLAEGRFAGGGGGGVGNLFNEGALIGSGLEGTVTHITAVGVAYGQWWRLITSGFLHVNLLHIAFNMYFLYLLGRILEPALGSAKFALLYFVSLLAGSLGALIVTPHGLTVGASGAIFGLMGAVLLEARARQIPELQSWITWLIVLNLGFSFVFPDISWGGHVGGLIGGALCTLMLQYGDRRRQPALALMGCVALGIGAFAGGVAVANSSAPELPPGVTTGSVEPSAADALPAVIIPRR
jgi:membrane associated rhomboid family serine protease